MSYTTQQVASAAGLTQRQLDNALRRGYIPHADPNPGTGSPRTYTPHQRTIAATYAALVKAGVTPRTAAYIANNNSEYEHGPVQIRVDEKKIAEALHNQTNDKTETNNREAPHAQAR